MQATLELDGRTIGITLRNLSADGARVEGDELPLEGTDLLFRKGELAVAGRVIWRRARTAGIKFERKLDPGVVLNHVPAPRPPTQTEYRRPGFSSRELTATERTLGKQWIPIPPLSPDGE